LYNLWGKLFLLTFSAQEASSYDVHQKMGVNNVNSKEEL